MVNKKNWLGILAMMLVFGMLVVGCDDSDDSSTDEGVKISGTVTVPSSGGITFFYYKDPNSSDVLDPNSSEHKISDTCQFTLHLPKSDEFNTVFIVRENSWRNIIFLTPGQVIKWTAKIDKGSRLEERINWSSNGYVAVYGYDN
jgi:hypothetical protein